MLRKIFVLCILLFTGINTVAAAVPDVNCYGLPGCSDDNIKVPKPATLNKNLGLELVTNIIGQVIQFVAVIAVISLILSGMMFLFSGGEEEKVKKAKSWIIWSLVGVIISITAWGIINILNNIGIGFIY